MKYNKETVIECTEPQVFCPPREMLVWDDYITEPIVKPVVAISRKHNGELFCVTVSSDGELTAKWKYCGEIPSIRDTPVTWMQLASWLCKGFGVVKDVNTGKIDTGVIFRETSSGEQVDGLVVKRFGDLNWHTPGRYVLEDLDE